MNDAVFHCLSFMSYDRATGRNFMRLLHAVHHLGYMCVAHTKLPCCSAAPVQSS
jgi:hypothetical protein